MVWLVIHALILVSVMATTNGSGFWLWTIGFCAGACTVTVFARWLFNSILPTAPHNDGAA